MISPLTGAFLFLWFLLYYWGVSDTYMTLEELEEIRADLAIILADWYLDKDISIHYDLMYLRIMQLNDIIDNFPDEYSKTELYYITVELCYNFYYFRDRCSKR